MAENRSLNHLHCTLITKVKLLRNGGYALTYCGIFHLGLLIVCAGLSLADARLITGVNAWVKPMKFCASIAIYVFTLAIYLNFVEGFEKLRLWLGRAVAAMMYVEIAAISFQAARGVTSHYNISTAFDGTVFAVMGIAIGLNTVLDSVVFGLLLLAPRDLKIGALWGMRFGLIILIAAGFEGGAMVMHQAHAIGGPDGGPGLPFVNWSVEHGDLRIAHFLGLHALQLLPLIGFAFDRVLENVYVRTILITAASAGYGALMWWQTKAALAGQPFLRR